MEAAAPTTMPAVPPSRLRDHGLGEELAANVPPPRAYGQPHADLAGAFGHRYQHDVHDADAAHDECHAGDAREQVAQGAGGLVGRLDDVGAVRTLKSSSLVPVILWRTRSSSVTPSCTSAAASLLSALTSIPRT